MATVRVSGELITDTINIFRCVFEQRMAAFWAEQSEKLHTDQFRSAVRDYICDTYGLTPTQYNTLPDGWVQSSAQITVLSIGEEYLQGGMEKLKFDSPIKLPLALLQRGCITPLSMDLNDLTAPYHALVKAANDTTRQMMGSQAEAAQQLRKVLHATPSLKRLSESYPALMEYVPQHYIDRMNEVKERKVRETATIDTSSLNLTLVQNRMAGVRA